MEEGPATLYLPERLTLPNLREAVQDCRACPLYRGATRAIYGEGLRRARLMLVGEQPGDREDREGRPFVGPAGRLLDSALEEAGVARDQAFVTNAVKHFKFELRGKRRIHKRPNAEEIRACRPWLEAEVKVVAPELIVALGATAAAAVIGRDFRVTRDRGSIRESTLGPPATGTIHPSAILRAPDDATRHEEYGALVEDLREVARRLAD